MATAKQTPFEFGKKLSQLDAITTALEQDDVDLDQGLGQFEAGMKLVAELKLYLAEATNRVEQIKAKYETATADEPLPF